MSNLLYSTDLVLKASPQALTSEYVLLGSIFTQPDADVVWLKYFYDAGDEAAMDLVCRTVRASGDTDKFKEVTLENTVDGVFLVSEQVNRTVKENAGGWRLRIEPEGEKHYEIYVKAHTPGISFGTVWAFVEFYSGCAIGY